MNTERDRWPRRWPLAALAVPAGVATWSGWVGLGGLTGFGKVHPLPGIVDGFTINSAITLPIGVEAYAAYALSAWLTTAPTSDGTRRFARNSAIGALVLGMLGQVAYHLLASEKQAAAPWEITTAVSCLPVLVLGFGAALAHMLHRDRMAALEEDEAATTPAAPVIAATEAAVPDTEPAMAAIPDTEADTRAAIEPAMPDMPAAIAAIDADTPAIEAAVPDAEADTRGRVTALLAADPDITGSEIARQLTLSERHARRLRSEIRPAVVNGSVT